MDQWKYKNLNILGMEHIFLHNKKILNLCLRWLILKSYHFVAEVTVSNKLWKIWKMLWSITSAANSHYEKKNKKTTGQIKFSAVTIKTNKASVETFSI